MAATKHPLKIEQGTDFSDLTYWKAGATVETATVGATIVASMNWKEMV
jgi:hypothetical protein